VQDKTDEILTRPSSLNNTNNESLMTLSADVLTNYSMSKMPLIAINDYSSLGDSGGSGENLKAQAEGRTSQEKGVKIMTNYFLTTSDDNPNQHEATTNDVFYVVLTGAPSDDVQVTLEVPDALRGSLSQEKFLFTPENWNTPQKVSFKQDLLEGSKGKNFKIKALAAESGGYTGSEQDSAIFNVNKPVKQIQQISSSMKQTEITPEKDPINLDIERITIHEELSPVFSILRIMCFPIIALRFALGSMQIFQKTYTPSTQSKGQSNNQQVEYLSRKELNIAYNFDWASNQQSSPLINDDQHFVDNYSSILDLHSQSTNSSYL
jgi:hypothetical protein